MLGVSRTDKEAAILLVCQNIPEGKVATYGQIASLAGFPKNARLVGTVLRNLPSNSGIPWHRVVNSQGMIATRSVGAGTAAGGYECYQRELLVAEGVRFQASGRIPLNEFQWDSA